MGVSSLSGKVADQVKGGLGRAHPQKEPSDTALRPLGALGLSAVTECSSGVNLDARPKCSPPYSALHSRQRTPKLTDCRQLIILGDPLPLPSHLFSGEPHPQAQVACLVAVEIRYQRVKVATRVVLNKSSSVLADPSTRCDQHRPAVCSVTLLPPVVLTGLAESGQTEWRRAVKFLRACCLLEKSSKVGLTLGMIGFSVRSLVSAIFGFPKHLTCL